MDHTTFPKTCLLPRASLLGTRIVVLLLALGWAGTVSCQETADTRGDYIRANYAKYEFRVPMRDGTKLFTAVYVPNDAGTEVEGEKKTYPVMMMRTPYSIGPYGTSVYRTRLGPNERFEESGYIFVFQDVRGKYLSEGQFINMRPHEPSSGEEPINESTDTYDTIEWISQNIAHHNGRFGQWGISYPGFYTAAGAIDSHPALKCISPQAPIGDWFWDDMHRNGAFNVQLAVTFFSSFGRERSGPTAERQERLDFGTNDAYQFFLELGPLKNVNERHFHREIPFWNSVSEHPNYDYFWKSRSLIQHLKNVRCASLVVGGWYDTEDLYGPLRIYESIEKNNPTTENSLVMGPWYHGGWNRSAGETLGEAEFGFPTAEFYREQIEFPFFEHHLKGKPSDSLAEATVFETGANRWRRFDAWPPRERTPQTLYLQPESTLSTMPVEATSAEGSSQSFLSDPMKPVPYTTEISSRWARDYMTEDQRFAARRPDVLVFRTEPLEHDLTIAGPLKAKIWFSTSGTSADVVVKLIDEFPGRPAPGSGISESDFPSGRQELVRGQVMRARFRESFELPKPLIPNKPELIEFELHDVLHTFQRGHRVMVQIQGSWFPFVDRNPQKYVPNIFAANEEDFIQAQHTIHFSPEMPSRIEFSVLPD